MAAASPSASDAFDVLGLAPTFDLDEKELEQRYRDLQRTLHPDRFAQAPASERRQALSRAVSVNDAYRALRDELTRAELIYARHGGSMSAHQADPELLMEMMELREGLAETKGARDGDKRSALTSDVLGKQKDALGALREAFAVLADGKNPGASHAAASALSRLRYYRRFLDEVAIQEDEAD